MYGTIEAVAQNCDDTGGQDDLDLAKQLRRINAEGSYVSHDALEAMIHKVEFPAPKARNVNLLREIVRTVDSFLVKLECLAEEAILDEKTHYLERCMSTGVELERQKRKADLDLLTAIEDAQRVQKEDEDKEEHEYVETCRREYREQRACRKRQCYSQGAASGASDAS